MTSPSAMLPSQVSFWDAWHRRKGASGDDPCHSELRQQFLELMADRKVANVADLGCGQGHDSVAFANAGLTVTAMDFSPVSVDQVRRRAAAAQLAISVKRHDLADRLPLPDAAVEGVYAHLSLHYFDDATTRSLFADIRRVLTAGGWLVFSVKSTKDPYYRTGELVGPNMYCRNGHLRHFFDQVYIEDLLHGWQKVDIRHRDGHYASDEPSDFFHVVARKPY